MSYKSAIPETSFIVKPEPGQIVKVYQRAEKNEHGAYLPAHKFGRVVEVCKNAIGREVVILNQFFSNPGLLEIDFFFERTVCVFIGKDETTEEALKFS